MLTGAPYSGFRKKRIKIATTIAEELIALFQLARSDGKGST